MSHMYITCNNCQPTWPTHMQPSIPQGSVNQQSAISNADEQMQALSASISVSRY